MTPSKIIDLTETVLHRSTITANKMPGILDSIETARREAMLTAGGNGPRPKGTIADPTGERAINAATAAAEPLTEIASSIRAVLAGLDDLDYRLRKAAGLPTGPAEITCTGGDPSTWGAPQCGRLVSFRVGDHGQIVPDRDGLCDDHLLARANWDRATEEAERRSKRAQQARARQQAHRDRTLTAIRSTA